jgi:hypothetical protein
MSDKPRPTHAAVAATVAHPGDATTDRLADALDALLPALEEASTAPPTPGYPAYHFGTTSRSSCSADVVQRPFAGSADGRPTDKSPRQTGWA